jgi:mitochondrial-processing peptidase subunit alpha
MFSNAKRLLSKAGVRKFSSSPGIIHKVMNTFDKSRSVYKMATFDPAHQLDNHEPVVVDDKTPEYRVTHLANGFTVLTESTVFPGPVNMSFLIDVGTRDETEETSGACLALSNTYLKTLKHTNETINYGMIQMSGGSMTMDFDNEKIYFYGQCLEYDTIDMFQMMVDIALEPRSVLAANVAKAKNRKSHDLNKHMQQFDPFMNNSEMLLRTAYGKTGLGMPRLGFEHNIDNVDARMLQNFIMSNITPNKCVIAANNVNNHEEFVNLCKERLGDFYPLPEHNYKRTPSKYIGGDYRTWSETPSTSITVAYESAPWNDPRVPVLFAMHTLIGSAQAFSVGGPGKGMYCRSITNLMQKYAFVEGAGALNNIFTDTGLFGMTLEGPATSSKDLLFLLLQELHRLREPIPADELNRAKNILKMNILQSLERDEDRLEEMSKNYMTYGKLTFHDYLEAIDRITSDDINNIAREMLKGVPTMVVTGSAINIVPSVTDVQKMLNG